MALTKIKVNEIDEKSAPVSGDYALVSDSENNGKLALIPFSGITDTLQNRWAYQLHSGGTITGEAWNIHSFSWTGTLKLPLASTVPVGTQIAVMVAYGENTSVNIKRDPADEFISPVGLATSYTLRGLGSSLVFVKVVANTWAALGAQEATINAAINAAIAPLAPLDSPTFTGTPTAPTAAAGTNTTQLANTKFVQATINDAIAPLASVNYDFKHTSFTAEPNKKYNVSTSLGDITVTLPELTEEMIGSSISIRHTDGTNRIIVNRSGTNTITEAALYTTYSFKGAGSYIDIIAYTDSVWLVTSSNRVAEPSADSDTNVAATTAWVRDIVGEAADTLQNRWAYQQHSGGVITGEPWNIHSFSSSGTLNLPKASTVPDGTQIAAMVFAGEDTSVRIYRDAGDEFLTPAGMRADYMLRGGAGLSLVFVKVQENTWATLGIQELLKEGTPASSSANGTKGNARFDADYFYVCTATNTWIRFAKDGAWT